MMHVISAVWQSIASIFHIFLFNDMNPIVNKGCKRQLNEKSADVYYRDSFDSGHLSTQLEIKMREEDQALNKQGKDKSHVLRSALWKLHYKQSTIVVSMYLTQSAFRFGSALFFEELIKWFNEEDASSKDGYIWGTLCVLSTISGNLISPHMFLLINKIGLKIKLSVLGLIHKKILKLNTALVSWQTTGQIVNFASNDLKFFEEGNYLFPYIITAPVELIISFILIGTRIGWLASFIGLFIMIVYMPFQGALMGKVKKFKQIALTMADERISAISEMITGILAVKSFTWEKSIFSKIKFLRSREENQLFKIIIVTSISSAAYFTASSFVPFSAFSAAILLDRHFDVATAFFVLIIITNMSRVSVTYLFPRSIALLAQVNASLKRLNSFLTLKEPPLLDRKFDNNKDMLLEPRGTIDAKIEDFAWLVRIKENNYLTTMTESKKPLLSRRLSLKDISISRKERSMTKEEKKLKELKSVKSLHNISFRIAPGELIGIVGEVGSGKSSLLSALLGEMQNLSVENDITYFSNETKLQHKQMYGSVSYCDQSPWILSGTVKENILFGSEFDEKWYSHVIKSCSLELDLEQFPAGDMTELGERGINLSGGQKARISLARAAYKKADINLLDDPLSAVDPKVANTLFDLCISNGGIMNGKTRLLVSHQVQFMNRCDRIAIMDSGRLVALDTYGKLMESEYKHVFMRLEKFPDSDENIASPSNSSSGNDHFEKTEKCNSIEIQMEKEKESNQTKSGKLVDVEKKETGNVSLHVYWTLLKYYGFFKLLLLTLLLFAYTGLSFVSQFWIYKWADQEPSEQNDGKWIWGLGIMCFLIFTFSLVFSIYNQKFTLVNLTKIHLKMINSVSSAVLPFFHTNPTGRIINRFSKDQSMADTMLVMTINDFIVILGYIIGIIIAACFALPYITILFPFYLCLVCILAYVYLKSSREIRRYDGITRSPIYEQISENLKGLATIRAYGMQETFNRNFIPVLNRNGSWWLCYQTLIRWFGIRLDLLSSCVLVLTTFVSIIVKIYQDSKYAAIALLNIMTMLIVFQYAVRHYGALENSMTGLERMLEYTELEKEPPTVDDGADPGPKGWPKKGTISFNNVSSRYRKELEPVLNNLTFEIPAGTSVGIIGRTGSGKSSFLLTLYRLIEKIEGNIYLDGIDIESVGLDVLRKNLAIIPQDPILFEGSLRFNLDPWNQFSDEKLWEILNAVQLKDVIRECGGLDAQLSEGGHNFSVGQRQLLCLARALLKDAKVLSVDEATANVDNQTDSLVQSSIREFVFKKNENGEKYRTLFVIAHRLDTILDCDVLMVFESGRIVEMGSPTELKMKQNGIFSTMLKASNDLSIN